MGSFCAMRDGEAGERAAVLELGSFRVIVSGPGGAEIRNKSEMEMIEIPNLR